jgi:hypothetical protein
VLSVSDAAATAEWRDLLMNLAFGKKSRGR